MALICTECSEKSSLYVHKRGDGELTCAHELHPWRCYSHGVSGLGVSEARKHGNSMPLQSDLCAFTESQARDRATKANGAPSMGSFARGVAVSILEDEISALRARLHDADALSDKLAAQIDDLRSERVQLGTEIGELHLELAGAQGRVRDLEVLRDNLKSEFQNLRRERDEWRAKADRAQQLYTRESPCGVPFVTADGTTWQFHSCKPPLGNPTREEAIAALRQIVDKINGLPPTEGQSVLFYAAMNVRAIAERVLQ